jgi:ABC-type molybdate transport system substrate-binding protein
MNGISGTITRRIVRQAVKLSRTRPNNESICQVCLLAILFSAIRKEDVRVGIGTTRCVRTGETAKLTRQAIQLMNLFDDLYDHCNIDKLYHKLKALAPVRVLLTQHV